jgi:hypothetical protein
LDLTKIIYNFAFLKKIIMKKFVIKPHSYVDLITNSSTEIFTLDNSKSEDTVREILKMMCQSEYDLEWFERELRVSTNENGTIEVYSFLNSPDWFCDFVEKTFNVVDSWFS